MLQFHESRQSALSSLWHRKLSTGKGKRAAVLLIAVALACCVSFQLFSFQQYETFSRDLTKSTDPLRYPLLHSWRSAPAATSSAKSAVVSDPGAQPSSLQKETQISVVPLDVTTTNDSIHGQSVSAPPHSAMSDAASDPDPQHSSLRTEIQTSVVPFNLNTTNGPNPGTPKFATSPFRKSNAPPKPAAQRPSGQTETQPSVLLTRQIAVLDAMNPPQPKTELSPSFGNLTKFTELRNKYFDTATIFGGAQVSLKLNSRAVTDVGLLFGGKPIAPYKSGLQRAATSISNPGDLVLHGREGFVYNQPAFAHRSGYKLVTCSELDAFRHPALARPPTRCRDSALRGARPWLVEFSNVWMSGNGDIFVPVGRPLFTWRNEWNVHAYTFQGGHAQWTWSRIKRRRVVFRAGRRCKTSTRVGFSLTQNHGSSYYHVIHEVAPRLLTFWDAAMAVIAAPGGKIVAPSSAVAQTILRSFGVPRAKIQLVEYDSPCFFERVYVPAPFVQGAYQHACVERVACRIIGDNFVGATSALPAASLDARRAIANKPRPVVVLISRARTRNSAGTRCRGSRCMANFPALRKAVEREFGDRIELHVLSAQDKNLMRRGIELFHRATIVIGMHGAGFSNIMFMRGPGTYAIHLGWRVVWQIYGNMAQKFDVDFVNIVTRGASQRGSNAVADIPVVILEVRTILEREGYPLDPPRIRTDPKRNARVTMRLPKSIVAQRTTTSTTANSGP